MKEHTFIIKLNEREDTDLIELARGVQDTLEMDGFDVVDVIPVPPSTQGASWASPTHPPGQSPV